MEDQDYEVRFDEYCHKCAYSDRNENESPCYDCLDLATNVNSVKPVYWKKKD